ncbi:response regulator [Paenibacillaceae bacterium]|nr:response regulator [Paenibacillaceae bacterium]
MKTILIVDDEQLARQHMRTQFPWADWGYTILDEAENGIEALELCRSVEPDIALLDITMPLMDGVELLHLLKQEFPRIRCIMLTAHRDFSFAQEAIRSGADGYILKSPIAADELRSALSKACEELDKTIRLTTTEQSYKSLVLNYQYPLRQKFFEDIQSSLLAQPEEIIARGKSLGIELVAPSYMVLECSVDELVLFEQRYPPKDRSLVEFSMLEIVRECAEADFPCGFELFPVSFGRFVLLLTGQQSTDRLLKENIVLFIRKLSNSLAQYLKLRLLITVSRPFSSIASLGSVYKEAIKYRIHHFYSDAAEPVFTDQALPFHAVPDKILLKLEERLEALILTQEEPVYEDWSSMTRHEFLLYKPEPQAALHWLESLEQLPAAGNAWHEPHPLKPLNLKYETSFLRALDAVIARFIDMRRQRLPSLQLRHELSAAIQYIKTHLSDELNAETIAFKVQLSPSYLGQLFKKEVGVSIVDYILEQRMEMAKHFLQTGQYRNYELASKVGFRSYSYFCTLFKKYTGITPNEYKHAHQPMVER